jgi:hypothetical protein
MSARIIRFPPRRLSAIWILPLGEWGWLVPHGAHCWLHGNYDDAIEDAQWLSRNTGWPIRRGVTP